nr:UTP--glucose-1-phosphate uridylyltransferase-like [Parasteatoda tepidariorum]
MRNDIENLMKNCPRSESDQYWKEFNGFLDLFDRFLTKRSSEFQWERLQLNSNDSFIDYEKLPLPENDQIKSFLNKLVIIKLNGGLGTSMNCVGAKSLLFVRNECTFLDLIVQQIIKLNNEYDVDVPLVFMNSFNTHEDTLIALEKYRNFRIKIFNFNQSQYPRIHALNYKLVTEAYNDEKKHAWYPPGHGDFYKSFYHSGLLQAFIKEGKEICMVSNADNLGASVNFPLLKEMMLSNQNQTIDCLVEVTPKTIADRKGGAVVKIGNKLHLVEVAQVPSEHMEVFQRGEHFNVFNTNNMWIRLDSILKLVVERRYLSMDVIVNHKILKVNGEPEDIIQLETAMGSAINLFECSIGVVVPRSRFLPVKTTSDFFLIKSNVYVLKNGTLLLNPLRRISYPPLIELVGKHFTSYSQIKERFPEMPDCLNLLSLTVSGDIVFGKNIVLKGNVLIQANPGEKIDVPSNTVLDNCQVITPYA